MCSLRENIEQSDVYSTCVFAERLTLMFNMQAWHEYFNGGATISMEGVVIGKLQDSSIVHSPMDKLIFFKNERYYK